jgi:hypothetical protein
MLRRIAGKDHRVRLLSVDVLNTATQAVGPQLHCRVIRCRRKNVGIADLGD